MIDFSSIQYNSEHPTFTSTFFTVLFSLFLGIMIAFTYDKTSRIVTRPNNYLQAIVLISIVSAIVIQAIGDSVARGLGMLGALSVIRFRTTVRNPRNIVFMFGAIAAGIACGVFGYVIALVGTSGFCLTAFALRLSSFSQAQNLTGLLKLELPNDYKSFSELDKCLQRFCQSYTLNRYKVYVNEKKANLLLYEYQLQLKDSKTGSQLVDALKMLPDIKLADLTFQNHPFETI